MTYGAIGDGGHSDATRSQSTVVLDQCIGNLPLLTHTLKTTRPDDPISEAQATDFSLCKDCCFHFSNQTPLGTILWAV